MRAVFIADAHLKQPADANYRALLAFLAEQRGETDILVLLGDICEFLVGIPDHLFPNYVPLFDALERLAQGGTRLIYVEGNHDFHLSACFRDRFPCLVLPDGGPLQLGEQRVLLVHGDQANPADRGYHLLRTVLRSLPVRLLIGVLPPAWLWWIAARSSRASRGAGHNKSRRWPARDILLPYAAARLAEGYQAVVTGHFHQPFREQLAGGELIALGDWIGHYSYAVWEDGAFRLETYDPAPD
jgi:UDP-2,3-diacylglucosamine hydrolase